MRDASAATTTITCTNLAATAATASGPNSLSYDDSAGTCFATSNGVTEGKALRDITFISQAGAPEVFRIGTGGSTTSLTAHNGCSLGTFTAAAGVSCSSTRNTVGTETGTVSIDGENGATIRMTINYTISNGGSDLAYNSASVTITTTDAASDSSPAAQRAVQGSVTRSQSVVIGQNFGSRVSNVATGPGGAPGSGGIIPSGTVPGTQPDGGTPVQQFGMAGLDTDDEPPFQTNGSTLRGLAMLASFDTSRTLAAADTADSPIGGPEQRIFLSTESPITIWGHGSFTDVENTRNRTDEDNRYDGSVWGYNLGADYRFSSALVAGMSVGYAKTDITTTFETGTYEEDTWNLSPYVIYTPSDTLTFSAIAGYAFGDVAKSRNTSVTGNTDSKSWYLQVDVRQTFQPIAESPLLVTGGLGALTSRNTLDAYSESDGSRVEESSVNTVQLKPNAELAYAMQIGETAVTPFVKGAYVHDFTDQTNGDAGAFDLGGGLRVAAGESGLSGSIEGSRLVGRDDYREYSVSAFLAYGFSVSGADGGFAGIASPYVGTSLSDSGTPEVAAGATLIDLDDRFSSKLSVSGDPSANRAAMMITVDLKF
ncbi:hypothetical protein UF64_00080 [Thalassospira sp. HJ]|nr:hypothetical protein UF64_00080 [Thalassospira sp. HJ]